MMLKYMLAYSFVIVACAGCKSTSSQPPAQESAEIHQGPGPVSVQGWVRVENHYGSDIWPTLLAGGCSRVDFIRPQATVGEKRCISLTVLLPCLPQDVARILKILSQMPEGRNRDRPENEARVVWQIDGNRRISMLDHGDLKRPLWEGLLAEIDYVACVDLTEAIFKANEAEALAGKKDLKAACEMYKDAMECYFRWGVKRVNVAVPMLIWEPEILLAYRTRSALEAGDFPKALESYRYSWREVGWTALSRRIGQNIFAVSFNPSLPVARDLPPEISPQVLQSALQLVTLVE